MLTKIQERAAAENGQDNSGFKTDVEKGDQLFGNWKCEVLDHFPVLQCVNLSYLFFAWKMSQNWPFLIGSG